MRLIFGSGCLAVLPCEKRLGRAAERTEKKQTQVPKAAFFDHLPQPSQPLLHLFYNKHHLHSDFMQKIKCLFSLLNPFAIPLPSRYSFPCSVQDERFPELRRFQVGDRASLISMHSINMQKQHRWNKKHYWTFASIKCDVQHYVMMMAMMMMMMTTTTTTMMMMMMTMQCGSFGVVQFQISSTACHETFGFPVFEAHCWVFRVTLWWQESHGNVLSSACCLSWALGSRCSPSSSDAQMCWARQLCRFF